MHCRLRHTTVAAVSGALPCHCSPLHCTRQVTAAAGRITPFDCFIVLGLSIFLSVLTC